MQQRRGEMEATNTATTRAENVGLDSWVGRKATKKAEGRGGAKGGRKRNKMANGKQGPGEE